MINNDEYLINRSYIEKFNDQRDNMSNPINIIDVKPDNLEKIGFFCKMSKMKSEVNKIKLSWLE